MSPVPVCYICGGVTLINGVTSAWTCWLAELNVSTTRKQSQGTEGKQEIAKERKNTTVSFLFTKKKKNAFCSLGTFHWGCQLNVNTSLTGYSVGYRTGHEYWTANSPLQNCTV